MLLDSVCQYFIEDFHIDVHQGYWPEIFFFCCVSARFWYQDDASLIREEFLFFCCMEWFQKEWYHLLLILLVEFGCKSIWSWAFLVGRLLITASILELIFYLFKDSISFWFCLGSVHKLIISSRFSNLFV